MNNAYLLTCHPGLGYQYCTLVLSRGSASTPSAGEVRASLSTCSRQSAKVPLTHSSFHVFGFDPYESQLSYNGRDKRLFREVDSSEGLSWNA